MLRSVVRRVDVSSNDSSTFSPSPSPSSSFTEAMGDNASTLCLEISDVVVGALGVFKAASSPGVTGGNGMEEGVVFSAGVASLVEVGVSVTVLPGDVTDC